MAGSRLEKVGTIYTRVTGLMQSGAHKWEDRPLWYDVYEKFPPKEEPRFDRPAPNIKIKPIFYEEDKLRALFHRNNPQIGTTNLANSKYKSLTQRFIENYKKLDTQYAGSANEEQLYKEVVDILNKETQNKKQAAKVEDEAVTLSGAFKEAQKKTPNDVINIKISDIFKD